MSTARPALRRIPPAVVPGLALVAAGIVVAGVAVAGRTDAPLNAAQALAQGGAAVVMAVAAVRLSGAARFGWAAMAASMAIWALTDAVAAVTRDGVPIDPSWLDVGWLLGLAPLVAGVAVAYWRLRPERDLQGALDALALALVAAIVAWDLLLRGHPLLAGSPVDVTVSMLYPTVDLALAAALGWLAVGRRPPEAWLLLLTAGLVLRVLAGVALVRAEEGGVERLIRGGAGYTLAAALLAVAALGRLRVADVGPPPRRAVPPWAATLPLMVLPAAVALMLWGSSPGAAVVLALALAVVAVRVGIGAESGRRAERRLEESEARFRQMADESPALMWLSDAAGGCTFANRTWLDFTGRPMAGALGDGWLDAVHPDDRPARRAAVAGAAPAGGHFAVHYRLLRADGAYRWMTEHGSPRRDGQGRLLGFSGTCLDVTEQRDAQVALAESEQRLAMAVEAAGEAIWDLDPRRDTVRLSERWFVMLGLPPEDGPVSAARMRERVHPDDLPAVLAAVEACTAGRADVMTADYRMRRADGGWIWVHDRGRVIERNAAGRPLRALGAVQDITERHQLSLELAESEERLALAIEANRDGLWDWDVTSGHVRFSEAWCRMLGLEPDDVAPHVQSWELLVHPDDLPGVRETLQAHMEGLTDAYESEHRVRHAEGRWIWVLDRGRVVATGDDGRPLRMVGTHTDVTARREAEDAVRRERERLRVLMGAMGEGLVVIGTDHRITEVNDTFCRMTGFGRDALLGATPPFPCWPPEHAGRIRSLLADLDAGGAGAREAVLMHADGTRFPVEANFAHLGDEGVVTGHLLTVRDITARRAAAAALRESEERLAAVIAAMGEGVVLRDADGRAGVCNAAACAILGLPEAQVLGYEPPDPRWRAVREHPGGIGEELGLQEALTPPRAMRGGQMAVDRPDGTRRWAQVSSEPFGAPDAAGRPPAVLTTFTDVTERRLQEEAVRASEERFRLLAENASDVIVRADPAGRVLYASPSAERVLGHPAGVPAGPAGMLDHTHPDDRERVRDAFGRVLGGEEGVRLVFRMLRADRQALWMEAAANAVRDGDGEVVEVQVALRDVTDRHAYEAEQEALRRVATLVAGAPDLGEVFPLVAREAALLLEGVGGAVLRVEGDEAATVGLHRDVRDAAPGDAGPVLTIERDGPTAAARAWREGRAACAGYRVGPDHLPAPDGPGGERQEAVAAPVRVAGAVWGLVAVTRVAPDAQPFGAADAARLTRFADLLALAIEAATSRAELERLATTDHLTGLANHRVFHERLETEVGRARRYGRRLALVLLDLDHFKQVNDRLGHLAGDRVLREVAQRMRGLARAGDTVGRVGGEELAWLLPETGADDALAAAERLRVAIAGMGLPGADGITASLGTAELEPGDDAGALYGRADAALYWAKAQGRDRAAAHPGRAAARRSPVSA